MAENTLAHFWFDVDGRIEAEINIQEGWHCENCVEDPGCEEILGATSGGCCFFKPKTV